MNNTIVVSFKQGVNNSVKNFSQRYVASHDAMAVFQLCDFANLHTLS